MIEKRMINKDVLVAITSFNPDFRLKELVNIVNQDPSVSTIVIYDNNSENGKEILQEIEKKYGAIHIFWSKQNNGLGLAYNYLIKTYLKDEYFVITFDQDSKIDPFFVSILRSRLINENSKNPNVISIGPRILNVDNSNASIERKLRKMPVLITSGNLFFIKAYNQVGGFDDDLFIDCVDFDFSLRLRSKKFALIQDREICLYQDIGEVNEDGVRLHSNIRMYYMIRNHIRLSKKYFFRFPLYIVFENIMFIRYLCKWKKYVNNIEFKNIIKKAIKES